MSAPKLKLDQPLVLIATYTCGGVHPGQVKPGSPIELTTSRVEALQARQSCASPLEFFT